MRERRHGVDVVAAQRPKFFAAIEFVVDRLLEIWEAFQQVAAIVSGHHRTLRKLGRRACPEDQKGAIGAYRRDAEAALIINDRVPTPLTIDALEDQTLVVVLDGADRRRLARPVDALTNDRLRSDVDLDHRRQVERGRILPLADLSHDARIHVHQPTDQRCMIGEGRCLRQSTGGYRRDHDANSYRMPTHDCPRPLIDAVAASLHAGRRSMVISVGALRLLCLDLA